MSDNNKKVLIYIAGPDVFSPDDIEMGKKKVEICEKYGFVGIYPTFLLPEDLFSGKYDKDYVGEVVSSSCIKGIIDSDVILGNMTPFRGFEMDSGTAFEMGVAKALGKKLYGYSMDNRTYIERMRDDGGGVFVDKNGTHRDKNGFAIEDVNEGENSMISKSCSYKIVTPGPGQNLTLLELFEKAVIMLQCELLKDLQNKEKDNRKVYSLMKWMEKGSRLLPFFVL